MSWQVPRIWEGGDVWILGGGASILKQFDIPSKIIQNVMNGTSPPSVYSPYMQAIHKEHVIGINVAYLIGTWIDMVFFGDNKFLLAHKDGLAAWPGLKVSCHSQSSKYNWIKTLPKDNSRPRGISPNPKNVSWNTNSGSAAISIAANAGAKRVILLGFDMKHDENGYSHWHKLYVNEPRPGDARNMRAKRHVPYVRHLRGFPEIARDAKLRGITIINANPDSAIEQFPKRSVKEILNENISRK